MWSPFQRRRRPASVDGAIERYRRTRRLRPVVGLFIPANFAGITGVVVGVKGSGKWMRVELLGGRSRRTPEALQEGCLAVQSASQATHEACEIGFDLGEVAAELVEELLGASGISIEDALAASVLEPGIRWQDYDGRGEYTPLFQPQRFAERTGLNVIDAFPAADLACGGQGGPLEPLASWLLFADRLRPITRCWRYLLVVDEVLSVWQLPPSDGLDAELPEIRLQTFPGLGLLDALHDKRERGSGSARTSHSAPREEVPPEIALLPFAAQSHRDIEFGWDPEAGRQRQDQLAQLAVQGKSQESVRRLLRAARCEPAAQGQLTLPRPSLAIDYFKLRESMNRQADQIDEVARQEGIAWPDVFCSTTLGLLEPVLNEIQEARGRGMAIDVIVAGRGSTNRFILSELRRQLAPTPDSITAVPEETEAAAYQDVAGSSASAVMTHACEVWDVAAAGFPPAWLPAVQSAVLGIMHIDQMPASLPWLTGCMIPRLHGRLTPGRPTHWRKLVIEMADYHPPAMKLREAV